MSETETEYVPGAIVPHTVARSFAERHPIVLTSEQLFDEIRQPSVGAAGSVAGKG